MEVSNKTKALLVVSFGSSYSDKRSRSIGAIESAISSAFPERLFYRAWTSNMLRKKVEREEGLHIDSVDEAMERMLKDGVNDLLVQPTHLLLGEEYKKAEETVRAFAGNFSSLAIGGPLLADSSDVTELAGILEKEYPTEEGEMLVLMGHGSAKLPFPVYECLEKQLIRDGYDMTCVGTVEFEPGIDRVLEFIRQERPQKVHLAPILTVAGDHVINDMSGDAPDSWKNRIGQEGTVVMCHIKGLGEIEQIRSMFIRHAENAKPIRN